MKKVGIGCLVVVVILGIAGVVVVKNIKNIGRNLGAGAVTAVVDSIVEESGLSEAEKTEIMVPVKDLAAEFKKGDITLEQLGTVLTEVSEGSFPTLLTMRSFEILYLEKSALDAEAKKAASVTVSRYTEGHVTKKIKDNEGIQGIIWEKTTDAEGKTTNSLKETLTAEELNKCLEIMKNAADKAEIPNKKFDIDIAASLKKSIEDAKANLK